MHHECPNCRARYNINVDYRVGDTTHFSCGRCGHLWTVVVASKQPSEHEGGVEAVDNPYNVALLWSYQRYHDYTHTFELPYA